MILARRVTMCVDRRTRYARLAVHRALNTLGIRGTAHDDGQVTLLTVNYQCRADTERLVRSWSKFVGAAALVVENSGPPRALPGARVRGLWVNLHHGLGLDFGLRFVGTQYVVIADPDSIVTSERFWPTVRALVDTYGAASIDIGSTHYHPMLLAFRTDVWKHGRFTMQADWERGWDVAGALTDALGGMSDEANLPRTYGAGRRIPSTRPGKQHYVAEVYADIYSNTLGASRISVGTKEFGVEEGPLDAFHELHMRWRAWADAVVAGRATVDDFPTAVGITEPQSTASSD